MGRNFSALRSKPTFIIKSRPVLPPAQVDSLSGFIKGEMMRFDWYWNSNAADRKSFIGKVIRELRRENDLVHEVQFVRPVTEFVPRALIIKKLSQARKGKHVLRIEQVSPADFAEQTEGQVLLSNRFKKHKPNSRQRKALRFKKRIADWKSTPDQSIKVDTSQMIRRRKIDSVNGALELFTNIGLTIAGLIDFVSSLVRWAYYAWTSDELVVLERMLTYFGRIRVSDGDRFAEIVRGMRNDVFFLFTLFCYVAMKSRDRTREITPNNLIDGVVTWMSFESVGASQLGLGPNEMRPYLINWHCDYAHLVDLMVNREAVYLRNLLLKLVNKELTRIRGIRLFYDVTQTVLSLPVMRLIAGTTRIPRAVTSVAQALNRLTSDPSAFASEPTSIVEMVNFLSELSEVIDIRSAVLSAESALYNRGRRDDPPNPEDDRFTEL